MADEAFALSPISARAALPDEADYDAIREAFMETARGRWFLGEYAKRNRNADTTMVLDAVTRIEQAMAAQKQQEPEPPPSEDDGLADALAAIRGAVEQAAEHASAAFAGLDLKEKLTPITKGSRIIREISWRWREIGADGRICDMIDSQLAAIEESCRNISATDGSAQLTAAFDLLKQKIDDLSDGKEIAPSAAATTNARVSEQPSSEAPAATAFAPSAPLMPEPVVPRPAPAMILEAEIAVPDEAQAETAFTEPELPFETAPVEITPEPEPAIVEPEMEPVEVAAAAAEVEQELMQAPAAAEARETTDHVAVDVANELASNDVAEDLAHDEAVLEMVAIEMAAPDDTADDFLSEDVAEISATLPPVIEPVIAPEPTPAPRLEVATAAPPRLEIVPTAQPQYLPERAPSVAPEMSLGASLIANGILPRPKAPSDPMAPIRRMSQAEKIAFFS